jgi:hypothetical protein
VTTEHTADSDSDTAAAIAGSRSSDPFWGRWFIDRCDQEPGHFEINFIVGDIMQ